MYLKSITRQIASQHRINLIGKLCGLFKINKNMPLASNCIYKVNIPYNHKKLKEEVNFILENSKDRGGWVNTADPRRFMNNVCVTSVKERTTLDAKSFYTGHVIPGNTDNAKGRIDVNTGERVRIHDYRFREKVDAYFLDEQDKRIAKESDLVHHHSSVSDDSELKNIGKAISEYFSIPNRFRVRMSNLQGVGAKNFTPHVDQHTPWRVHICLEGDENSLWWFRNHITEEMTTFNQPQEGCYLVRTNTVQHWVSTKRLRRHIYWHLYHNDLVGADGTEYIADRTGELALP